MGISLNFPVSYLVKKTPIILVTKPSHGLGQELPVTFSNVSSAASPITVLLRLMHATYWKPLPAGFQVEVMKN